MDNLHASIPCCNQAEKIGLEPYRVDPDGGMYFKGLDFNQASFRKKSKKRELTDEQRKSKKLISKMLEENGKSLVIEVAILKNLTVHLRAEYICDYEYESVFAIYVDGNFSGLITIKR